MILTNNTFNCTSNKFFYLYLIFRCKVVIISFDFSFLKWKMEIPIHD